MAGIFPPIIITSMGVWWAGEWGWGGGMVSVNQKGREAGMNHFSHRLHSRENVNVP